MAKRIAKPLSDEQLSKLLADLPQVSTDPITDRVVFLLSFKAGLRAQEIAGLRWKENLYDASGDWNVTPHNVGKGRKLDMLSIFVGGDIAKSRAYGQERVVQAHPMVFEALKELRAQGHRTPFVVPSRKRGASQDLRKRAHALATRINRLYADMGLDATSHSGRRTLISKLALAAQESKGHSLRNVQILAGHKRLTTTEQYIVTGPNQASLIMMG